MAPPSYIKREPLLDHEIRDLARAFLKEKNMKARIEGGAGWCYMDRGTSLWEPVSQMAEEAWQADFVYLAPDESIDAASISRDEDSINVRVYRTLMPGHPNIEVEFLGDVKSNMEKCPVLSYKLGPDAVLYLSYGKSRLIVRSGMVY